MWVCRSVPPDEDTLALEVDITDRELVGERLHNPAGPVSAKVLAIQRAAVIAYHSEDSTSE